MKNILINVIAVMLISFCMVSFADARDQYDEHQVVAYGFEDVIVLDVEGTTFVVCSNANASGIFEDGEVTIEESKRLENQLESLVERCKSTELI